MTNELYAMQTAGNFQWFLNNVPIIGQTQYHIHLEQQGNYSVTVSKAVWVCYFIREFLF